MDFDIDALKGMKVKVLWAEKNEFQFPETIRPVGKKLAANTLPSIDVEEDNQGCEWGSLEPDPELPPELR